MSKKVCKKCGNSRENILHDQVFGNPRKVHPFEPADDIGGERKPRFKVGDRVTWRGQKGMCFGTIKRQYKPENCDNYVLILDIGDGIEFPHGELNVEAAPSADGRRETDLERQLAICEQNGTKWAQFRVADIRALLNRAAPAPVSGEGE